MVHGGRLVKPPKKPYYCETKCGNVVRSEVRAHDGQVIVTVYHEDDLLDVVPVDSEDELAQVFWESIIKFGGEK